MHRVIHFHNGAKGGVFSVTKNLIEHSNSLLFEHHIIYTINRDFTADFTPPPIFRVASVNIFYYSANWNFYYTCSRLSKYINGSNDILVANDWLELGMVSILGLNNPLVHILHGDFEYYYDLAQKHSHIVDQFIVVSNVIAEKLSAKNEIKKSRAHFLPFPVNDFTYTRKNFNSISCIYFVSNISDPRKNFPFIIQFDNELINYNFEINWIICGGGYTHDQIMKLWKPQNPARIKITGFINSIEIDTFFKEANFIILPSFAEGFPVSIVEAMKAGVIPIVNNWGGSVSDLIIDGITGFYIDPNEVKDTAAKMINRFKDGEKLSNISTNASRLATKNFNPYTNTSAYENIFIQALLARSTKLKKQTFGSRLDKKWFPNLFVKTFRIVYNKLLIGQSLSRLI